MQSKGGKGVQDSAVPGNFCRLKGAQTSSSGAPLETTSGLIPCTPTMLTQAFRATTFNGGQERKVPVWPAKTRWATEASDLASLGRHGLICETLVLSPWVLEKSKEETHEKVLPNARSNYSY